MKRISAALLFFAMVFIAVKPSQSQEASNLCFPIGTIKVQAESIGEYPAFSFRDFQYSITFTMYINPETKSYTLTGVADINPDVECVSSIGTNFAPAIKKTKGIDS